MQNHVSWWVELAVKPGQLANFEKLTAEMIEATRTEAGVLSYQRFISNDNQIIHVYERYADSSAAVAHLRRFREVFSDRFASMVERRRFHVYGDLSTELRTLLDEFGVTYLRPFGSFDYWP
jgi:quinol monooxygenase YgiN